MDFHAPRLSSTCAGGPRWEESEMEYTTGSAASARFPTQIADLTSRMNLLENAERRRLALEVKRRDRRE